LPGARSLGAASIPTSSGRCLGHCAAESQIGAVDLQLAVSPTDDESCIAHTPPQPRALMRPRAPSEWPRHLGSFSRWGKLITGHRQQSSTRCKRVTPAIDASSATQFLHRSHRSTGTPHFNALRTLLGVSPMVSCTVTASTFDSKSVLHRLDVEKLCSSVKRKLRAGTR
jgi:hypothetical protein